MKAYKAKPGEGIGYNKPNTEKMHLLAGKEFPHEHRSKCGRHLDISKSANKENVFDHLKCKRCFQ